VSDEDQLLDRALACHQAGQLQQAADFYQQTLRINPDKPDALYLFGCLAYQNGQFAPARELLRQAVSVAQDQAEYHHALGLALNALEEYEPAIVSFTRTLVLAPAHQRATEALAQSWYGLGCAKNSASEFAVAQHCFSQALNLQPDWLEARHNLGRALYESGFVSEAFRHFKLCAEMNKPGSEQSCAMLAVIVPGVPEAGNAQILATRKAWLKQDLPPPPIATSHHTPLRAGYVSSFFHRDNWMKPVWGLINQHDRRAIQVHLFSDCAAADIQHGYRAHPEDIYLDASALSNDDLAKAIQHHAIDVLVDLNGYSNMRRLPLFAQRVAPLQIGWFNMYATTGLNTFDYLIGDANVILPEEEPFYSEKIIRVDGSYLTFDVNYPVPPIVSRPHEPIVYGALASQYKITEEVVEAWSQILHQAPATSLLLKNKQMATDTGRNLLTSRFARHGINPERLHLEGPEPHFNFLRAYERIDIALDTFPYNGGTTTTEALWQGVPVVTFHGDRWASRTSASILRAANLHEFVATDLEGYIALAVAFAHKPDQLTSLRKTMRRRLTESPVCNTKSFAQQMEKIYRELSI
jgi:predicted O-linked N-acetylglucosamine transferase (SPINDLY family)